MPRKHVRVTPCAQDGCEELTSQHGWCVKHYREHVPATLPCEGGCGKTLRRNRLLARDYPGTQVVVARRRCYRCYTQGDYAEGENAVPDYQTHEETWIRTQVPDDLVHYFGIEV